MLMVDGQDYNYHKLNELDNAIEQFSSQLLPQIQDNIISELHSSIKKINIENVGLKISFINNSCVPAVSIEEINEVNDIVIFLKQRIAQREAFNKVVLIKLAMLDNIGHLFGSAGDLATCNIINKFLRDNFIQYVKMQKPKLLQPYYTWFYDSQH